MLPFEPDFYATVAQVLPVLLLVVAAQYRFGGTNGSVDRLSGAFLACLILVTFAAEVFCIAAIQDRQTPGQVARFCIYAALALNFIGIAIPRIGDLVAPSQIWRRSAPAEVAVLFLVVFAIARPTEATSVVLYGLLAVVIGVLFAVLGELLPGTREDDGSQTARTSEPESHQEQHNL